MRPQGYTVEGDRKLGDWPLGSHEVGPYCRVGSVWMDGTGTTTRKDRAGNVTSITGPNGEPVKRNKYGEEVQA